MSKNPWEDEDSKPAYKNPFEDDSDQSKLPQTSNSNGTMKNSNKDNRVSLPVIDNPQKVDQMEYKQGSSKNSGILGIFNTFTNFLPLAICLILSSLVCLVLFGFTCWQFENKTTTTAGSYIEWGNDKSCGGSSYRPLRIRFGEDPEYLYCSWSSSNQALRFILCLVAAASPFVLIIAIRKKWRIFVYFYATISFVYAGLFFWAMVIDATQVNRGNSWCQKGLPGTVLTPPNIAVHCGFWPYTITVILDVVAIVIEIITAIMVGLHARKKM